MYAGLTVTEGLLTGEASYSGDKIPLEVINAKYMLLRELLQEFIHEYLFEPVAIKKGFVYEDEFGDQVPIYPTVGFTRLAIRDSADTFDNLFNLYQKGSIPVSLILELLNIEPSYVRKALEADAFTMNDANFNEVFRNIYTDIASQLVEKTDIVEKIAEYLKLKIREEPSEEGEEPSEGGDWD